MKKEDLIEYKKKLSELRDTEKRERDINYLRKLATGEIQGPSARYASIDKPWLGYYPEEMFFERKKYNKRGKHLKPKDCSLTPWVRITLTFFQHEIPCKD